MAEQPVRRKWIRFSLRSLLLAVFLAGSGMLLWAHWAPWFTERIFRLPDAEWIQVKVSPDGSMVYGFGRSESRGDEGYVWRVEDGKILDELKSKVDLEVEFSPDSQWIASARGGEIKVWSRAAERFVELPGAKDHKANLFTFSSDSKRLIAFLFPDGEESVVLTLDGSAPPVVLKGSISRDGFADATKLIAADSQGYVRCWNILDGTQLHTFSSIRPDWTFHETIPLDSERLFLSSHSDDLHRIRTRLINLRTFEEEQTFDFEVYGPLSPDRKWAVVKPEFSSENYLYNLEAKKIGERLPSWTLKECAAAYPSFSKEMLAWLAVQSGRLGMDGATPFPALQRGNRSQEERETVLDQVDGTPLCDLVGHMAHVSDVFAPVGERIGSYSSDEREIRIWGRRRPEYWWGIAWLPEFWVTVVLAVALMGSVWGDGREKSAVPSGL